MAVNVEFAVVDVETTGFSPATPLFAGSSLLRQANRSGRKFIDLATANKLNRCLVFVPGTSMP